MCYLGFQYYMGLLGGCYNNTNIHMGTRTEILSGSNTILISMGPSVEGSGIGVGVGLAVTAGVFS